MQAWLRSNVPDLYSRLEQVLQRGPGCKAVKSEMIKIYKEVFDRGIGSKFNEFIKQRFSYIIVGEIKNESVEGEKPTTNPNKHRVFAHYNPALLTFPHKLIIVDPNKKVLERRVRDFVGDKLSSDWIIIDDRAYIEYFLPGFEKQANAISKKEREIYRYKIMIRSKT